MRKICTALFQRVNSQKDLLLALSCLVMLVNWSSPVVASEQQAPFFATVKSITSGNSLMVKPDGDSDSTIQVVLAFLSIPHGGQPYTKRAHDILQAQLLNRRVSIRPIGKTNGEYINGLVYIGNNNFNLDFLQRGHAWVDHTQVSHQSWLKKGKEAIKEKRGLHADPMALHPYDYTQSKKKAELLLTITETMQKDPELPNILKSAFFGNKTKKVYVPALCIDIWAKWPYHDVKPYTTLAAATRGGYRSLECPKT